jgi:tyrosinase
LQEVLFSTWHRPFLALFEQILVGHARTIAAKYTGSNKAKYVAAANTLRIPYWDWARDGAKLPASTTATTVSVNTPTGRKTIRNPLYSYKFQKFPFTYANFGGTIGQYPQTMRCPSTSNSQASSRFNVVNSNLARDQSYLKNSVVRISLAELTWAHFERIGTNSVTVPDFHPHQLLRCHVHG